MSSSQRFFVFIRAINVGSRRLTNDQLMAPFGRLGFEGVAAYQAAGNITFRSDSPIAGQTERFGPALAEAYGFDPVFFVRTDDELRAILEARPFTATDLARTAGKVQVSFLHRVPDDSMISEVRALIPAEDRIAFVDRHWFWLPENGVSDSQLPVSSVEDVIGPMTMRTLGTIGRMLAKFEPLKSLD